MSAGPAEPSPKNKNARSQGDPMGGLYCLWSETLDVEESSAPEAMLSALDVFGPTPAKHEAHAGKKAAFGMATHGLLPLQRETPKLESDDALVLIDGEFHSRSGRPLDGQDQLAVARDLMNCSTPQEISKILREVDGVFSFLVYRKTEAVLMLGTDKFGLKPIFFARQANAIAFASNALAVLRSGLVVPKLDKQAAVDLLFYGFVMENRTLLAAIERMPPATIASVSMSDGAFDQIAYWTVNSLIPDRSRVKGEGIGEDLFQSFANAVDSRLTDDGGVFLGLSGGLDSRAILAAAEGKAKAYRSLTMGVPGCADKGIAEKLARISGIRNSFLASLESELKDIDSELRLAVQLSDGLTVMLGYFLKHYLDHLASNGYKIRLSGHGAEALKVGITSPVRTPADLGQLASLDDCVGYIDEQARITSVPDSSIDQLLSPEMADAVRTYRGLSVKQSFSQLAVDAHPIDVFAYWYLHTWTSRYMASALSIDRMNLEIRLPFTDTAFLEHAMACDRSLRVDGSMHIAIVSRFQPSMIKVRNVNTGAPLDSTGVRLTMKKAIRKIASRLTLTGYRHYSYTDDWQRGRFSGSIKDRLLGERCLARGVFDPDGLKTLVTQYMDGDNSQSRVIPHLLCFEEWCRINLDDDRPGPA